MTAWTDHLLMAPIVVPMLAGAIMILIGDRRRNLIGLIGLVSTVTLVLLAGLLLTMADEPVVRIYRLGNWPTLFGIVLVLDRLTAHAPNRIVIFDSPPALAASPASELAMHVGQAMMVVRADQTGEAELRDAVNILSGCENIRLLLNCTRFSPTGRRFGSYYGYKE